VAALPRGRCPACFRDVALRVDGSTRQHRPPDDRNICRGSGEPAGERVGDDEPEPWLDPRECREALGVTQVELARFLNVGPRSVQRAERTRTSPNGSTFVVWAPLVRLALNPRPLVVEGNALPLRRWLARGSIPARLREQLWAEVLK